MNNYIPDVNKFKLSGPPDWWLRQLWEFDPSLVVIPSRQGFFYRLAQRRKLSLADKIVQDVMKEESDTRMLASYSLIPVTTILATANWSNPLMWNDLAQRAPWRQGGADKVNKHILEMEEKKQKAIDNRIDDNLTERSKDGWKLYQHKTGARLSRYSPGRPKGPSYAQRIIIPSA